MTFSQQTKEEIKKNIILNKDCCERAFLYAVFRTLGSYSLRKGGIALAVSTENRSLLELTVVTYNRVYGKSVNIEATDKSTLTNNTIFTALFDKSSLEDMEMIYYDSDNSLQLGQDNFCTRLVDKPCCKKVFVQTLFLCCGSVVVPELLQDLSASNTNSRYHLELVFGNFALAQHIVALLAQLSFNFRVTTRKSNTVLYIKESETIADFLVYVNSMKSKLMLENIIIERDIRNQVNRQSNCNLANIDRSIEASQRQIDAIVLLQSSGQFATLSQQLQQVALLRLANEEATLEELAKMCGMTKSGVRHRLNKIVELANQLGEE